MYVIIMYMELYSSNVIWWAIQLNLGGGITIIMIMIMSNKIYLLMIIPRQKIAQNSSLWFDLFLNHSEIFTCKCKKYFCMEM